MARKPSQWKRAERNDLASAHRILNRALENTKRSRDLNDEIVATAKKLITLLLSDTELGVETEAAAAASREEAEEKAAVEEHREEVVSGLRRRLGRIVEKSLNGKAKKPAKGRRAAHA